MASEYNLALVALSYCISVLGSYTALKLAKGMATSRPENLWFWVVGSAFALGGGGVWAMHFVGMLAFDTPVDFGYDLGMTLASLVLAVVVVGLGLYVVGRNPDSLMRLLSAGLITGLGVASMHYTGMEAMVMPGEMIYDPALVGASILIAVGASICALWLAFNVHTLMLRILSAMVMGVAVCGMHYTGMAAMHMNYSHSPADSLSLLQYKATLDPGVLAVLIAVVVVALLLSLLVGTMEGLKEQERRVSLRIDR
ncbi:MHYT domain-containing protein [Oceanobacter antarcticus]|jgi:NO-binding membrane sensor protein with MHYT domain|uniref:MHYT domain-containing protein n=1 Tax=Oceanobacter antarcticus TaxID=3133425 RepID=A0ABW8NE18_9GAMM